MTTGEARDPIVGLKDPFVGLRDPTAGFRVATAGFRDPTAGFRGPIAGFSDPMTGFNAGVANDPMAGLRDTIAGFIGPIAGLLLATCVVAILAIIFALALMRIVLTRSLCSLSKWYDLLRKTRYSFPSLVTEALLLPLLRTSNLKELEVC